MDVRRFFESRLQQFGNDPRTLDWAAASQQLRFRILSEVTDLRGKRVADLGSGLGHLWGYLRDRFDGVRYTGYDFSEVFVAEARKANPGARFEVLDVLREKVPDSFDVVVSSGLHNLEVGTNEADMATLLRHAWDAAGEAVAVNMLSARATQHTEGRHYYDPARVLHTASELAPYVVLRQDYLPHDFTVYLYRRPPKRS